MSIKMSRDACIKAQHITEDTYTELINNTKQLESQFNAQLLNLNDKPTTKKYMEMMSEIQSLMSKIRNNFNDIDDYCDRVIKWIDEYNSH